MNTFDQLLTQGLREAVDKYKSQTPEGLLSDLYIQWLPEEAMLKFYDDEENFLTEVSTDNLEDPVEEQMLRDALDELLKKESTSELLDPAFTLRPFSVVLVDEDMKNISEHFLLDSDSMVLDRSFMENLDKELDDFMNKLFDNNI
ncbi:MAG: hypothetical protein ACRCX4_12655 [Bacteroidales bacterium]